MTPVSLDWFINCGTIVGIWYWCTDQYIVQRTLAANNITIARRGAIFGAYLKLLPILIFLVPGIIAFALTLQQPEVFRFQKLIGHFQC